MATKVVRLDIPGVSNELLAKLGPELCEIGDMMSVPGSSARNTLRTAARVMQAVHLAMLHADAEEEDLENMTHGEVAIVRNLKIISERLGELKQLAEEATKKTAALNN